MCAKQQQQLGMLMAPLLHRVASQVLQRASSGKSSDSRRSSSSSSVHACRSQSGLTLLLLLL
jgi:hypothetical protein